MSRSWLTAYATAPTTRRTPATDPAAPTGPGTVTDPGTPAGVASPPGAVPPGLPPAGTDPGIGTPRALRASGDRTAGRRCWSAESVGAAQPIRTPPHPVRAPDTHP